MRVPRQGSASQELTQTVVQVLPDATLLVFAYLQHFPLQAFSIGDLRGQRLRTIFGDVLEVVLEMIQTSHDNAGSSEKREPKQGNT